MRERESESEQRWDRENRKRKENWNTVADLAYAVADLRVMIKLTVQNRQAKVWGVRGALRRRSTNHQGTEGAGARPEEDEEHQAQR